MDYKNTPSHKVEVLERRLMNRAGLEHQSAYDQRVIEAQNRAEVDACAGHYEGQWQRLLNRWEAGEVLTDVVITCLQNGNVINDTGLVRFSPVSKLK